MSRKITISKRMCRPINCRSLRSHMSTDLRPYYPSLIYFLVKKKKKKTWLPPETESKHKEVGFSKRQKSKAEKDEQVSWLYFVNVSWILSVKRPLVQPKRWCDLAVWGHLSFKSWLRIEIISFFLHDDALLLFYFIYDNKNK